MDGAFIKDIFNLTILMAASVGTANHAVLIAWAVVESENGNAWRLAPPPSLLLVLHLLTPRRFFLSNLHIAIPRANQPPTYNNHERP